MALLVLCKRRSCGKEEELRKKKKKNGKRGEGAAPRLGERIYSVLGESD